ncbi:MULTISPECIES: hypothetical protein [unclassified Microcoleus]|uniref:hypothetical protein n=1 Tax=unclassified Microcoleus TaxID=2642155 RepID=UPI002FCFB97B
MVVGSWQLAVGSWQLVVGSWQLSFGIGNWELISQLQSAFSFLPFASFLDLLHKSLFN